MKFHLPALGALVVLAMGISASGALWTDIDPNFTIISYSAPFTAPTTYTIVAHNDTASNYTDVHFVVPFHFGIDALPPTIAQSYSWNNSNSRWEFGAGSIAMFGVGGQNDLVLMSDTDIPLTYAIPGPIPGGSTSILSTDLVPIIPIGDIAAGETFTFHLAVDFAPTPIKSQGEGFFVVAAVPEPGMGQAVLALAGLLARPKRIKSAAPSPA